MGYRLNTMWKGNIKNENITMNSMNIKEVSVKKMYWNELWNNWKIKESLNEIPQVTTKLPHSFKCNSYFFNFQMRKK
jgi:ribosomal protein L5